MAKLVANEKLRDYVQDRLSGLITRPDGTEVPGPTVRFIGRRHGRRKDRRWAKAWSPEQISKRLQVDFPNDETMRISHEAIYQALFIQGRGALAPGAGRLPAHRPGSASSKGPDAGAGQEVRHSRGDDQRAARRG